MIALTSRLNERDETIIQLQEELDAFDRIHKEVEGVAERRQIKIDKLKRILAKHGLQQEFQGESSDDDSDCGGLILTPESSDDAPQEV